MDIAKNAFQDFIPAGEEAGSPYTKGGFQDFVPAPEPVKEVIEIPSKEKPVDNTPKK